MTKNIVRFLGALPLALALAAPAHAGPAAEKAGMAPRIVLKSVKVTFPKASRTFRGPGAGDTHYCLICHSGGMVTTQPPMSMDTWKVEVTKMQKAFGCPVPDEKVAELTSYFYGINNKKK